jgi:hypothetical protein
VTDLRFTDANECLIVLNALRRLDAGEKCANDLEDTARKLAHAKSLTYLGEVVSLGRAILTIADRMGDEAVVRLTVTEPAPKFCEHCKRTRALEATVESLARTASNALDAEDGSKDQVFATSMVLNTLADMVTAERKVA